MDLKTLGSILTIGETVAVEFKRCGNGIENDTYETVCSFLNRFGGDIFLGVLDDGTVMGLPEKAASDMVKNFIRMISNTLMHREFTSSYIAKFVIERERMYVENANRASGSGFITPENLEPNPKNPIIASFFRTIGFADDLGSGTRKLFKYSKYYSGKDPEFIEGDVFRINVPLDDGYSFDYSLGQSTGVKTSDKTGDKKAMPVRSSMTVNEKKILDLLKEDPLITQDKISAMLGMSNSGVRYVMDRLKEKGLITRVGSKRNGGWSVDPNFLS